MGQCYVTFPGIDGARRIVAPRSLGIVPNSIILECVPQLTAIPAIGTLTIGHGTEFVSMPDVKVDWASMRMSTNGHLMTLKLLDRRWRWRFLLVSGRYNVRRADGTIDPATQKSPQELAAILFTAMGELAFDVSQLPDGGYPEVSWHYANAAAVLGEICETRGCDISLNLDNSVSIVRLGFGQALPINADLMTPSITANPPEGPDVVGVLCGETLFESRLKLEAVGIDLDGKVKQLADLSYRPSGGFGADLVKFEDINKDTLPALTLPKIELAKQLAKASVYRWYVVKSQADGTQNVPGYGTISDISQIFPLNTYILDTQTSPTSTRLVNVRAKVFGTFLLENAMEQFQNNEVATNTTGELPEAERTFTINRATGLVKFNKPVVKLDDGKKNQEAATLYLQTSYGVRDNATGAPVRYEASRNISGASAGVLLQEVNRMEELALTYRANYSTSNPSSVASITTNETAILSEVSTLLDIMQARWTSAIYGFGLYRSVKAVTTDGAIRQVVWYVDTTQGARTAISLNSETMAGPARHLERSRRRFLALTGAQYPTEQRRWRNGEDTGFFRQEGF